MSSNAILISESILEDVASAIKTKKGYSSSTTIKPYNFASEISSITSGGGITPSGSINISTNGTYDVTNYASAIVAVSGGSGGESSYTISITNSDSSHQTIEPSLNNNTSFSSVIYSSDSIQVNPSTISLRLRANTGYNEGTFIVDNTNTNSSVVNLTAANHTISTTPATVRDSTYIMNASVTVTFIEDTIYGGGKYDTTNGSILNGSAEYEQYGSTVRKNLIGVEFSGDSDGYNITYRRLFLYFDSSLGQITNNGLVKIMCGSLVATKDISNAWLDYSIYGAYDGSSSGSDGYTGDSFDDILNYHITNNTPIIVRIENVI